MKSRRQSKLSRPDRARKDRGNPPRSHNCSSRFTPTSSIENPPSSWKARRPASDSDVCCSSSGVALPRTRNRAGERDPVGEHAKHREQPGEPLDLIEDDEAPQRPEGERGVCQARQIGRVLQVEGGGVTRPRPEDVGGERRLAHLPRAENRHDGRPREQLAHPLKLPSPVYPHDLVTSTIDVGFSRSGPGEAAVLELRSAVQGQGDLTAGPPRDPFPVATRARGVRVGRACP